MGASESPISHRDTVVRPKERVEAIVIGKRNGGELCAYCRPHFYSPSSRMDISPRLLL